MERKQRSNQGRQQRLANRRRRRRRQRSPATSPTPAQVASRRPPPPVDAPAAAGATPRSRPRQAAAARRATPEPAAAAAEPASGEFTCPLCAAPVRDLYTAIAYGERRAPTHFDCIVSLLGEREEVEEGARLCYLGGGSFGIVQMRSASRQGDRGGSLLIHKRIEVEEKDAAPEWRQRLRLPIRSGT